ncbi:MAG: TonB family protein [Candidatus Eisenbacteria bacterium]|uniref:TonB family protein n=1 Tax=Eiseniibacteriota bacterium TaxID=2212470 RepID=A0A956NAI3_UNCEI|nr:TonB family protein [Candidatus Eisenbacteria bacterium]
MNRTLHAEYRRSLFAVPDPKFRRALLISSGLGIAVLAVALIAPIRVAAPPRVEEVPERLAKLILEKRKPVPPVLGPAPVEIPELAAIPEPKVPEVAPTPEPKAEPKVEPTPVPKVEPKTTAPPRRAREDNKLAEERGTAGRAKATTEVAQALKSTTKSVESTLNALQSDLASIAPTTGGSNVPERKGGRGRPGRGRSAGDVTGAVAAREDVGAGGGGGQVVTGDLIDIESVDSGGSGDLASADPGSSVGGGAVAGSFRSNASLLAVVRKYAAGIQFCYDNQLKREPGLEGKMVIVLTVLPSGGVAEASIAQDSLGSAALRECVLAQVREWKFPAIPEGTVTFRTPFVFTPPA